MKQTWQTQFIEYSISSQFLFCSPWDIFLWADTVLFSVTQKGVVRSLRVSDLADLLLFMES
jgi:hypothetical protein